MPTIEQVEALLKSEVLQKEVRLRQVIFGAKVQARKYIQQTDCQCILGCYLLGKESIIADFRDYPGIAPYMDDAARYLGITASDACDLMLGFDSYPKEHRKHPWAKLGWRIAEWADSLGMLERGRASEE